jgi:cytochrome c556
VQIGKGRLRGRRAAIPPKFEQTDGLQRERPASAQVNKGLATAPRRTKLARTTPTDMKLKTILTLLTTAAIGLTAANADDTPLAKEMKTINKSLRTLKRQVADAAKKDENLGLIATAKKAIDASMKLEPAKIKDIPAAERAAYLDKYKQQMTDLGKTFDDVEVAVKADKPDDAKKAFEKLGEQKERGHKDFGVDDE